MPKSKSVLAGLAISTALAGGIVGLSAATTATAANASVAQAAIGFQLGCGGGCGWRRGVLRWRLRPRLAGPSRAPPRAVQGEDLQQQPPTTVHNGQAQDQRLKQDRWDREWENFAPKFEKIGNEEE